MRTSTLEAAIGGSTFKTIYKHLGAWLKWNTEVHAAPGPVATDRLYYTGDGKPKMRVGGAVYDLAVPRPAVALTATLGGAGAGDVVTRSYVYTWVTSFGEESEPCPASNEIAWKPGNTVTLSAFAATPGGRSITHQRIYRTQTGQSGTWFYLIAERAASAADFADTIPVDGFQEPLPSAFWNAPPDDLKGLISLPNGMMAAFAGSDLYFCEPWRPHAWPEKYSLGMSSPIVALGAIGTSVVVMTTGNPHLVSGSHPSTMQAAKMEANLPCINSRGVADLGFAIAYPSNEGLVAAKADGSIGIVSANLFDRDDWLALKPSTIIAGQIGGRYVAFYENVNDAGDLVGGALFLDIGPTPFLIRSSERAQAVAYEIETGALYFLRKSENNVYRLDAPNGVRQKQYWRSKPFVLTAPINFGAIQVDADMELSGHEKAINAAALAEIEAANAAILATGEAMGEVNDTPLNAFALNGDLLTLLPEFGGNLNIGIYADGKLVAQIDRTNKPIRLPSGFKARKWEIDVYGDVQIEQIIVATTMDELKSA
ncbi:hypothetical protein [Aminobacter sp. MDW-2]|uniref:hypothetical protein n=1 Tax=Aminobacter sp. MDW-2 TaxID=2666139 RepID=UPI001FEE728B|nr:hypothetical protein [Aminobacter sp. MDW-2]